ncbi:hypothetical protein B0J14DRAFT_582107 [Halenospora varia]|nr:hypothetical protein B0J14DRAFT_582107 [Halenospora varia]
MHTMHYCATHFMDPFNLQAKNRNIKSATNMDSSPTESTPKRHSRHGSSTRTLPRRSTRGPLDSADPIANPLASPTTLAHQTSSQLSPRPSRYHTPHFSYLLRPEIYHPLTLLDVPPPFRTPTSQPAPTSSLQSLIQLGHFRSAAIKAAQLLTSPSLSPSNHEEIFFLLYTRLSSLTLCNQTPLAAQEVKSLEDLNSSYYRDDESGVHLVPWCLRVLAVRLQGMGYADARRGVMGYYDLAREARLSLSSIKKALATDEFDDGEQERLEEEKRMWEERLAELGVRVASALIEMEDLEGAAKFLSTLNASQFPQLETQKALLYLCLGDVDAARLSISSASRNSSPTSTMSSSTDKERDVILALAHIADSEYAESVKVWESLLETTPENDPEVAMYQQNLAVCYLYLGRMDSAREILEKLTDTSATFHALTFNLSTIYELCTERSRALKIGLAEKVADILVESRKQGEGERAGEKVNGDFKL